MACTAAHHYLWKHEVDPEVLKAMLKVVQSSFSSPPPQPLPPPPLSPSLFLSRSR